VLVRRVFEQGAYADRVMSSLAAGLEPRERAFATALSYGTVQRRMTLDHIAQALLDRPVQRLEPVVLAALRIGLFQLLYMGGVPDHAAVGESVELAKAASPGGARLVNAVLRRATREGPAMLAALEDATPGGAAIVHSVPRWLVQRLWDELGPDEARAVLARANEPAESAVRVNTLVSSVDRVLAELPAPTRPADGLPEGLVLDGPWDIQGSGLWRAGAVMAQSRASMLVSRVVAPDPGEKLLDLCAAPGAKTTHLAALMRGRGQVLAVERHPGRARALTRTCSRMRAGCVDIRIADAAALEAGGSYDRVLVDPPCSGLGTLQSRPDLRWRVTPESIEELAATQARILRAGAAATRPGGVLVYSLCTISQTESHDVLEEFLRERSDFSAEDLSAEHPELTDPRCARYLQLLPPRDRTDGFFIARLRRHD
jgi:16S rRNA (cytosine967-C5)-methyltransferase